MEAKTLMKKFLIDKWLWKYWIGFDILEECLSITFDKFSCEDSFYHDDFMKYFHWVLKNKLSEYGHF